jgi:hypothetical protein
MSAMFSVFKYLTWTDVIKYFDNKRRICRSSRQQSHTVWSHSPLVTTLHRVERVSPAYVMFWKAEVEQVSHVYGMSWKAEVEHVSHVYIMFWKAEVEQVSHVYVMFWKAEVEQVFHVYEWSGTPAIVNKH